MENILSAVDNESVVHTTKECAEPELTKCQQMICFNRIKNLPIIMSTIQATNKKYEQLKSYNIITEFVFNQAESTANLTMNIIGYIKSGIPLDYPLHALDLLVCEGLDYIESNIPGIKLPPDQMYSSSKEKIQEYSNKCINIVTKLVIAVVREIMVFTIIVIEIVQELTDRLIVGWFGKQEHQLTQAEYQMIIEAIRSCSDWKEKMKCHLASSSASTSVPSSPISDLSVEF